MSQESEFNYHYLLKLFQNNYVDPYLLKSAALSVLSKHIFDEKSEEKFRILFGDVELTYSDTKLVFGDCFNKEIKQGMIPSGITHVTFGYDFDQKIQDIFPDTITHVTFGHRFNQELGVLPKNITYLEFGNNFDREIKEGTLPNGLVELKFGDLFDQEIIGIIPDTVTHLTLNACFSKEIRGHIPKSVKHVSIYYLCYEHLTRFYNTLPKTVTTVTVNEREVDPKDFYENEIILDLGEFSRGEKSGRIFYRFKNMIIFNDSITNIIYKDHNVIIKLYCGDIITVNENTNFGKQMRQDYFEA